MYKDDKTLTQDEIKSRIDEIIDIFEEIGWDTGYMLDLADNVDFFFAGKKQRVDEFLQQMTEAIPTSGNREEMN